MSEAEDPEHHCELFVGNGHSARRDNLNGHAEAIDSEEEIESEQTEDEEEGEEEGEEDDDEPALKYERIGGFLPDLFKKDSASALAIRNKLLVRSSCIAYQCCPVYHHPCRP
jgi:hypothetical protein